MKIGIISDTHGYLPASCKDIFHGVNAIFHAGDIGDIEIIKKLEEIAPVYAVCGNMDYGLIAKHYPQTDLVEVSNFFFFLMHEPFKLDIDPRAAGVNCVIFGHTHKPQIYTKEGVLFINPGSASFPKLGKRPTIALCTSTDNKKSLEATIIEI